MEDYEKLLEKLCNYCVLCVLIACSTNEGIRDVDSGNVQNTGNIESEINANLILVNYMHVVDSCVVLNLSQKEAEALGVSDYYYQKAQKPCWRLIKR